MTPYTVSDRAANVIAGVLAAVVLTLLFIGIYHLPNNVQPPTGGKDKIVRIEFAIGAGYTKDGHKIPPEQANLLAHQILREVVREFGGGFVTRGEGGWVDDQGNAIFEPGITVTVDVVPFEYAKRLQRKGVIKDEIDVPATPTLVIDRATQIAIHAGKVFDQASVHLTFIEARSVNVDSELPLKIS